MKTERKYIIYCRQKVSYKFSIDGVNGALFQMTVEVLLPIAVVALNVCTGFLTHFTC